VKTMLKRAFGAFDVTEVRDYNGVGDWSLLGIEGRYRDLARRLRQRALSWAFSSSRLVRPSPSGRACTQTPPGPFDGRF